MDHRAHQNHTDLSLSLRKPHPTLAPTSPSGSILNNFMMAKSGGGLVRCLSKVFRDAYKTLRKALVGTDEDEETWRYCVDDTNVVLGFASGAMFVRQNFKSASKKLVRAGLVG